MSSTNTVVPRGFSRDFTPRKPTLRSFSSTKRLQGAKAVPDHIVPITSTGQIQITAASTLAPHAHWTLACRTPSVGQKSTVRCLMTTSEFTFGLANGDDDLEQIYRMRYEVLVAEMGKYRDRADHENLRLPDPEDPASWHAVARDGDQIVASMRMTFGAGLSERQIDQYSLEPWIAEFGADAVSVGERTMVKPSYRGSNAVQGLLMHSPFPLDTSPIRLVFGAAEPHLLSLYMSVGQLPYASKNINSDEAGYLIPLVAFMPNVEAMRGLGNSTQEPDGSPGMPPSVSEVLSGAGAVTSTANSDLHEFATSVRAGLVQVDDTVVGVFDDFEADEIERCLGRSNVIECKANDRVLKQGGTGRNLFVVLDGTLEVRVGEQIVRVFSTGDVFGEMAFLLDQPRAADVYAATDNVRVLSLSDGAIRKMISAEPTVAAKLLMNLSRALCMRLIKAG